MTSAQLTSILLALFLVFTTVTVWAAAEPATISAGDYTVTLGDRGVTVTHKGTPISTGSYFHGFNPGYEGTFLSSTAAWAQGTVSVSEDGRAATLSADLPGGSFEYTAEVSEDGVRVTVRITPAEDAKIGPIEYAIFHIPADLLAGGSIETWDVAGTVVDSKAIPAERVDGALAPAQVGLTLKAATLTIDVRSKSYGTLYPFDGRDERYGAKFGIWPFAGAALRPGAETISTYELSVRPPLPVRAPGTITIAPNAPASAVLTAADPTKREALAADELVNYLARITGKQLERREASANSIPLGAIVVGSLARDAGLVSQDELDAVERDGYVVKVAGGKAAICGWRDLGTVYGAYALLKHVGCRFYGRACETIPEVNDLVIPACHLADKPFYEFRKLAQNMKLGQTPSDDLMNPAELGEPGNIVHSAGYLLPFDKYHEEHPEYFALQKDGLRLHRDPNNNRFDVHLCLSNPDVQRISAERMLALIDKQSDRTFFGVSQGDGFAWCQCDECKALDAVPGVEMTDRLLTYVNYIAREVAKKYPDKRIITLAYTSATSPPPTRVMPAPNVMVQYCPYPPRTGCHSHDFTCPKNKQGLEDLTGWIATCTFSITRRGTRTGTSPSGASMR